MHIHYQDQVPDEIVEAVGSPELGKWFWDEYKNRQYAEFAAALKAQEEVSIANYKAQHRPHECLGENKFRIAKKLRNWIARKFGWAAATDLKFCEELVRDNKDKFCFVPTQEKRPMIVKSRDIGPPVITPKSMGAPVITARPPAETLITPRP